jgi:hypothetical protein
MTAEALRMEPCCRVCGRALSLDEMHAFDHGDGTSVCADCEIAWCLENGVMPLGLEDDEEGQGE